MLQLGDPALHLGTIVGRDVLLASQVFPQVGKSRIIAAQIVITSADVAHKHQHIGVGNAESHEYLGRFLVATLFIEAECLVGIGVALFVEFGGRRNSGCRG
jgi:hypothetical protein